MGPSIFQAAEGPPTFQEEYRGSYVPEFVELVEGFLQVVAPDTPYVAAAGEDKLYFIDTRFDPKTAQHLKEQIERTFVPEPKEYFVVDGISCTAETRNAETHETTFVFDPPFARVLFASIMNKYNPKLNLPVYKLSGDSMVTYDPNNTPPKRADEPCGDHGCQINTGCTHVSHGRCETCPHSKVDNHCGGQGNVNSQCDTKGCSKAVDTPKEDGEADTS